MFGGVKVLQVGFAIVESVAIYVVTLFVGWSVVDDSMEHAFYAATVRSDEDLDVVVGVGSADLECVELD